MAAAIFGNAHPEGEDIFEVIPMEFMDLWPALDNGTIDITPSYVTINMHRDFYGVSDGKSSYQS